MNFPTAAVWDMGTLTKGALEGGSGIPSRPLAFPMGPGNRASVLPRLPDLGGASRDRRAGRLRVPGNVAKPEESQLIYGLT